MPITLRKQAEKNGIIQYRQLSSNGLGTPFQVPATAQLTLDLDFDAPAVQPPDQEINTLIILGTTILYKAIECSPCLARTCRFGHYQCLRDIAPAQALTALENLGALR